MRSRYPTRLNIGVIGQWPRVIDDSVPGGVPTSGEGVRVHHVRRRASATKAPPLDAPTGIRSVLRVKRPAQEHMLLLAQRRYRSSRLEVRPGGRTIGPRRGSDSYGLVAWRAAWSSQ